MKSCVPLRRRGGQRDPNTQMLRFKNTVESCELREINYNGPKFTWIYQRKDGY